MNISLAGEFKCVIKRGDGTIKLDTGYQKNLITNYGLDSLAKSSNSYMYNYCCVGSGNSEPAVLQNRLDNFIKSQNYDNKYNGESSTTYVDDGSNLYKTYKTYKYIFTGLSNVNISEIGLSNESASSPRVCTRALVKSQDVPTVITVLQGEILEVYYRLWLVYDTRDFTGQINLLDGKGGSVAYNYISRLSQVGHREFQGEYCGSGIQATVWSSYGILQAGLTYTGDIGDIKNKPTGQYLSSANAITYSKYVNGSYKQVATLYYNPNASNGAIRSMSLGTSMGNYQIRFGSVDGDNPIVKTNKHSLKIPIELSWGRYEGDL